MEIARIEEDGDRIEAAMEHLQKALRLNNGGQYEEYLRLSLKRLQLCTMLYKSPERLEDRAALLIEQVSGPAAPAAARRAAGPEVAQAVTALPLPALPRCVQSLFLEEGRVFV